MADRVQIPLDDFVVGDVPMFSVLSGEPADGLVEFENDRGVVRGWWGFFLFLGPIGLLVMLALYVLTPRPVPVRGHLPLRRDEHEAAMRSVRRVYGLYAGGVVATLVAIVALAAASRWLGSVGGIALVGMLVILVLWLIGLPLLQAHHRRRHTVVVQAGSGNRWVDVDGVHPTFASAMDRQNRARHWAQSQHHPS